MQTKPNAHRRHRRRAAVVVQVAVMSTVILGMAALAVDLAAMYTTQNELQVAADAAALAAAAQLADYESGDPEGVAAETAEEYAERHWVWDSPLQFDQSADIDFGEAIYDPVTQQFDFDTNGDHINAVRVTVRRTEGSASGPMPLMFANIFGYSEANLQASAAAVLIPRDIAVIIDLSRSMMYDSSLDWNYIHRSDGGYSNLRDVWCALDGPEPSRPYIPADASTVDQTEYFGDTGPTYGEMTEWGDPLVPGVYDPEVDPGLLYIPRYEDCTDPAARAALEARGYSEDEVDALLTGEFDDDYSSNHKGRVKCILGLAIWHSGMPGGLDPAGGNGNELVGELEEIVAPPDGAFNWDWDYYVNGNTLNHFKYRYGLKTLMHYMIYHRLYAPGSMPDSPNRASTYDLWATPQEPLRAVKDAVLVMQQEIERRGSPDRMALEAFCGHASSSKRTLDDAQHEVNLTDNLSLVTEAAYQLQAGHYDTHTNIGGGMYRAIAELKSERARRSAAKVMVVLSDGVANRYHRKEDLPGDVYDWEDPEAPESWNSASGYVFSMARLAARQGIQIHSVGVGYGVDEWSLEQIAMIGNGVYKYASGDPTRYTQELEEIFRQLGGMRASVLIE